MHEGMREASGYQGKHGRIAATGESYSGERCITLHATEQNSGWYIREGGRYRSLLNCRMIPAWRVNTAAECPQPGTSTVV